MSLLNLLAKEEDDDRVDGGSHARPGAGTDAPPTPLSMLWLGAVLALALLARLLYLFVFNDPQNAGDGMTDTYHHWQIGYLTREIGLSHGLRLWDLKGVEYFWGLLHPLVLVVLFFVSGSIDIVIPRLLSLACGTLSVGLIFRLCQRYWNLPVAIAAAVFAAIAPVAVFDDTLGMVEPLAVALCLLGLWWWPSKGFRGGVAWGLAATARAEAWLFTLGLIVATFFRRPRLETHLPLSVGWALVMGVYMKILLDRTGNPIYPVYWEYAVEVGGKWLSPTVTAHQHSLQAGFALLAVVSGAALLITILKRPPSYLLLTFGFGYSALVVGLLAFTPFLTSWSGWVWSIRILAFPYEFAAVLLAVVLFVGVPRALGPRVVPFCWAAMIALLAGIQLAWIPIQAAYRQTEPSWQTTLATGRYLAALHEASSRRTGVITIPADHPSLTYALVRFGGVSGREIVGQLYDPFYQLPPGYRYADHRATAGTLLQCWLSETRTSLFVIPPDRSDYSAFVAEHTGWFVVAGTVPAYGWVVEHVQVPTPAPYACAQAAQEARSGR